MAVTSSILSGIGAAIAAAANGAVLPTATLAPTIAAAASGATLPTAGLASTIASAAGAGAGVGAGAGAGTGLTLGGIGAGLLKGITAGALVGGATNAASAAIQGGAAGDIIGGAAKGIGTGAATGVASGAVSTAANALTTAGTAVQGTTSASDALTKLQNISPAGMPSGASTSSALTELQNLTPAGMPKDSILSASITEQATASKNLTPLEVGGHQTSAVASTSSTNAIAGMKDTGTATNIANAAQPSKAKVIGGKVLKAVGQYGVQGVLSLASAGMAAKSASEANKIQQQGLLFQQKMYNEQKAEKESTKAKLKQDALDAYNSANLFGDILNNTESNNTLLTNTVEAQGDYSILSNYSRKTT